LTFIISNAFQDVEYAMPQRHLYHRVQTSWMRWTTLLLPVQRISLKNVREKLSKFIIITREDLSILPQTLKCAANSQSHCYGGAGRPSVKLPAKLQHHVCVSMTTKIRENAQACHPFGQASPLTAILGFPPIPTSSHFLPS
jgi:hypothetical protein